MLIYQDPPVGVSWLDYSTLPAVRLPDRAPRQEGPGIAHVEHVGTCDFVACLACWL